MKLGFDASKSHELYLHGIPVVVDPTLNDAEYYFGDTDSSDMESCMLRVAETFSRWVKGAQRVNGFKVFVGPKTHAAILKEVGELMAAICLNPEVPEPAEIVWKDCPNEVQFIFTCKKCKREFINTGVLRADGEIWAGIFTCPNCGYCYISPFKQECSRLLTIKFFLDQQKAKGV